MLFSIPTAKLKYDDILDFIKQNHREGVGLDYKEDFPKNLEKTICALANTYGGTVIIGVKDNDGLPEIESRGVEFKLGYEERVIRISVDNIFPPIIPEVAVCEKDGLAFVVVRVPQGRETPYTVGRNRVYIRTGNTNTPDDLATLDRIDWISQGRKKADEYRNIIIKSMADRSRNRESIQDLQIPFGIVSISLGPTHPWEPLFKDRDMPDLRAKISVNAYSVSFPVVGSNVRTVQGGVSYFEHSKSTGDYNYLEINKFGYLFYKEDMGEQKVEKRPDGTSEVKERKIQPFKIIRAVDLLLNSARKLYAINNFQGNLRLTVQAEKLLKIPVTPFPGQHVWGNPYQTSVDDQLLWSQDWSPAELESFEARTERIIDLGAQITFSFGFPEDEHHVRQMILKYSPKT